MSKDTSKLDEILKRTVNTDWLDHTDTKTLKADLLAWHREECERIASEAIGNDRQYLTEHDAINSIITVENKLKAEQRKRLRASLEVEDEK